jgi:hypothetical protein
MNVTLTIAGPLAAACSIYKALTGQAQTGVTVTPALPPITTNQSGRGSCQFLAVQNDPSTTTSLVFYGDANVKGDGTCQAQSIAVGVTYIKHSSSINAVSLINSFLNANGAAKVNIDVNYV